MAAGEGFSPSQRTLDHLVADLARHLPFSAMARADVRRFAAAATETYHAPGEVVLGPEQGVARQLLFIRRGSVRGQRNNQFTMHYEAGELFPVGAVMAARAVTSTYEALDDVFCLAVDVEVVREIAARSAPWADYLHRRVEQLLDASRRALRDAQTSQLLAERSLEAPLSELPRREPVVCPPDASLGDALRRMHEARVGSILAMDEQGQVQGILTRHDLLERVVLARAPESTPVIRLMSQPVATLEIGETVQRALLEMSRFGIRHLPLTEQGRVVSFISERDLFALQRLSIKQLSGMIREAGDVPALAQAGAQIRRFARHLMGQGLASQALTQLLSQLNDQLTERLVALMAARHGLDMRQACWLAFGSEGRSEQTIATDQDNGLAFLGPTGGAALEDERARWLAMGQEVNAALDACGYPLCKGGVMAGQGACCLSADEWRAKFETWIDRSSPADLLAASIFFDLRALAGDKSLTAPLQAFIAEHARGATRFLKLLADNALQRRPPLNWRGALDPQIDGDRQWIDLKLQGTAIFVDGARLLALAHGITATGTRERLLAGGEASKVPAHESAAWVRAFEYLQLFRLRLQVGHGEGGHPHPNRVDLATLDPLDRRILKEAFRVAAGLQDKLALDIAR